MMFYRAPDDASIKNKMVYAGSKTAFGNATSGIMVKINPTDMSEFTEQIIQDQCNKFT